MTKFDDASGLEIVRLPVGLPELYEEPDHFQYVPIDDIQAELKETARPRANEIIFAIGLYSVSEPHSSEAQHEVRHGIQPLSDEILVLRGNAYSGLNQKSVELFQESSDRAAILKAIALKAHDKVKKPIRRYEVGGEAVTTTTLLGGYLMSAHETQARTAVIAFFSRSLLARIGGTLQGIVTDNDTYPLYHPGRARPTDLQEQSDFIRNVNQDPERYARLKEAAAMLMVSSGLQEVLKARSPSAAQRGQQSIPEEYLAPLYSLPSLAA